MARVVVVEDDVDLCESLVECFRLAGLETIGVGTALELFQQMSASSFDVAVLDVNLPDKDGYSIADFLSRKTNLGIIFMTGRGGDEDRIQGFSSGADLYFVKPVNPKEMTLAVINLARRLSGDRNHAPGPATAVIGATGAWTLDRARWQLVSPQAKVVRLTAKELQFIERLAARRGEVVPRQELAKLLGQDATNPDSRGLDATIRRVRRKTLAMTGEDLPVQTVQALGLVFSGFVNIV